MDAREIREFAEVCTARNWMVLATVAVAEEWRNATFPSPLQLTSTQLSAVSNPRECPKRHVREHGWIVIIVIIIVGLAGLRGWRGVGPVAVVSGPRASFGREAMYLRRTPYLPYL